MLICYAYSCPKVLQVLHIHRVLVVAVTDHVSRVIVLNIAALVTEHVPIALTFTCINNKHKLGLIQNLKK